MKRAQTPDHLAMLVAWQSAVSAIQHPDRKTLDVPTLMSAESAIRWRAFSMAPECPENALALLRLITEFFQFCDGDLTKEELELATAAGNQALSKLERVVGQQDG